MRRDETARMATWIELAAALNAISYFVLSQVWGNLFGGQNDHPVAIGFPFLISHNGYEFPEGSIWPVNLFLYFGIAILFGSMAAGVIRRRVPVKDEVDGALLEMEQVVPRMFQLSIFELMAGTVVLAVIFGALGHSANVDVGALKTIYVAGPIAIAWIAWVSRRLPNSGQSLLVLGFAIALIVAAGWLAESIP